MNPAAPRDPVLTRVLLSIAGTLFLLNLCVLVAGFHAHAVAPDAPVERVSRAGCIRGPVMVPLAVDEMSVDLKHLRARVRALSLHLEETAHQPHIVVELSAAAEAL